MALIGDKAENPRDFWIDEYANSQTLLNQIDKAIYQLTANQASQNGIISYTIETGQTRQTVTKQDLPALYKQRTELLTLIDTLENRLGIGAPSAVQVAPRW